LGFGLRVRVGFRVRVGVSGKAYLRVKFRVRV